LYREENLTPEFLKINPTGTIPALVDGSVCVYDSHAIGIYLATKFGKNEALYPRDFEKRTVVNERLFFEASYLFARLFEICVS
jgi:glutathione S-transferase